MSDIHSIVSDAIDNQEIRTLEMVISMMKIYPTSMIIEELEKHVAELKAAQNG